METSNSVFILIKWVIWVVSTNLRRCYLPCWIFWFEETLLFPFLLDLFIEFHGCPILRHEVRFFLLLNKVFILTRLLVDDVLQSSSILSWLDLKRFFILLFFKFLNFPIGTSGFEHFDNRSKNLTILLFAYFKISLLLLILNMWFLFTSKFFGNSLLILILF